MKLRSNIKYEQQSFPEQLGISMGREGECEVQGGRVVW